MAIDLIFTLHFSLVSLPTPAESNHTPVPGSVTIAGSLQSELGCPGDWNPACGATHLAYDASDDVWRGSFNIPIGSYEYKAALKNLGQPSIYQTSIII
jgi:hypothetical protein